MDSTLRPTLSQRWFAIQEELLPFCRTEYDGLTPKLEQIIRTLEWVRVEEHVGGGWLGIGRPPRERCDLARAFVAKAVLGFEKTRELIDRLSVDTRLKRICGFSLHKELPSESTFSRAFAEFAESKLAAKVHQILIQQNLGENVIGHVSRDSTAIHARERMTVPKVEIPVSPLPIEILCQTAQTEDARALIKEDPAPQEVMPMPIIVTKQGRDRPRKGAHPVEASKNKVAVQRTQTLSQILKALPTGCDIGTKKNAKGFKETWRGYKLHLDTADCGVPLTTLVSAASMHDSLAAIPLAITTAQRVSSLYDLMDAAYCSQDIREHSRELGHIPLIDHNPRGGEKKHFAPHEAERYKERSQAERTNARLKDEFGLRQVWVRSSTKVSSHLHFAVLALAADQLMRLLR